MEEEKYELLLLSSQCGELHLARLLSHLFSNEYLYVNAEFRAMLEQDRKGFVSAKGVLMHPVIQQYFQEIDLVHPQHQLLFLKATLRALCPHLHYSEGRIRRLDLWQPPPGKPIGLTGIRQQLSISDIRDYFGDGSFTPNCQVPSRTIEYALVYGEEAREKARELKKSSTIPFKTNSYRELFENKARNSRINLNCNEKVYKPCSNPSLVHIHKHHNGMGMQQHRKPRSNLLDDPFMSLKVEEHQYPVSQLQPFDADIHDREAQIDQENFNSLVRQPNPSFNELLRGFARAIYG